jgi:bifunctional non-homologous end joining protein LigD
LPHLIYSPCCSVPFRPGSSRRAFRSKRQNCLTAANGCTRLSTTVFGLSLGRTGRACGYYSHPGNDLTHRFPLIVDTLARLRSRSCIIDGEAVACDDNGVASFDRVRYHRANERIFLYAFDLIELNGDDLRPDPLEGRKATLQTILAKAGAGIRFNEHMEGDGETVFRHACKLGLEGVVSKRRDSAYRSGRSPDWLKMKNSDAPAVKREEEEEWGKKKRR